MKFACLSLLTAVGFWGTCSQFASAQTFKRVQVQGGTKLAQIAPGGVSVWARATNGKSYILKGKQFVLANSKVLSQLAVGGGSGLQPDTIWGLDSANNIYTASPSGTTWVFSQVPGVLDFIVVGIGYDGSCHPYEVWGLNPAAQIYRYNYCIKNWEQVAGTLSSVASGGGAVWGINGNSEIFRFDFSSLSFDQMNGTRFKQVVVGPNDVWAIALVDDRAYEFDGVSNFLQMNTSMSEVQAGGDGLWGTQSDQSIWHWDENGRRFDLIPGALGHVSVGSGGGVWGLDSTGKAYAFTRP